MAKKRKKKKGKKGKKRPVQNFKKVSTKDLKGRRKSLKRKIKKADKAGDTKKADTLRERRRGAKKEIMYRKAGIANEGLQSLEDVLNFAQNDSRYKLLSPDQQKALTTIVNNYNYSTDVDTSTLTKSELKSITGYAARIMDPYYDQKKKDINKDYEVGLADTIKDLETGIDRYQNTLNNALERGDQTLIEETQTKINQINQALPFYKQSLDEFVTYKRQYLEEQIESSKSSVEESIGRADEDAILAERAQEQNYTAQLKDLQKNMQDRGYAWSEERTEEEGVLGEQNVDILTSISQDTERQKMDAVRAAEEAFGSDAVSGIQGAEQYIRGGFTGTETMATDYDIEDAIANYNQTIFNEIAEAERLLGTSKLKELYGDQYNEYLTGDIEGSYARTARERREGATYDYNQSLIDLGTTAARAYGTNALKGALGKTIGEVEGVSQGFKLPTGTGYKQGFYGRTKKRNLRENTYQRKDAVQQYVDQEKAARQYTYQS